MAGRRRRHVDRLLPVLAADLARSVHAGATLVTSLEDAGAALDEPLRGDVERVRDAISRGVPVERSLRDWAERATNPGVTLLVTAARLGHSHGGDLGVALDAAAVSLLDRVEVDDEARALASQARSSAMVLVALPPFGAVCFCLLDPAVGAMLFATPLGWVCLLGGALLDAAGAWLMARMVDGAVGGHDGSDAAGSAPRSIGGPS